MVPPDSHRISRVPRYSGYRWASARIRVRGFHPLRPSFPDGSTSVLSCRVPVLQPQTCRNKVGLGSSAFARHYWRNHYCFLLLRVLRCFSSPRSPPDSNRDDALFAQQVAPFGNPRIDSYLPIPAAYRSLSRPSSPSRAQASPMCPC